MAFALGLAAVYMTNGLKIASEAVPVKLPETRFGDVLVVTPANAKEILSPFGCLASCPGDVDKMPPIRSVKLVKATEDDWSVKPGSLFLKLTDEDGHHFSI